MCAVTHTQHTRAHTHTHTHTHVHTHTQCAQLHIHNTHLHGYTTHRHTQFPCLILAMLTLHIFLSQQNVPHVIPPTLTSPYLPTNIFFWGSPVQLTGHWTQPTNQLTNQPTHSACRLYHFFPCRIPATPTSPYLSREDGAECLQAHVLDFLLCFVLHDVQSLADNVGDQQVRLLCGCLTQSNTHVWMPDTVQWTCVDAWHSLIHASVDAWHSSIHTCGCLAQFNAHVLMPDSSRHSCVDAWHSLIHTNVDAWHSSIQTCGCLTVQSTHVWMPDIVQDMWMPDTVQYTCVNAWNSSIRTCGCWSHFKTHMCGCLIQFNAHVWMPDSPICTCGCLTQFNAHVWMPDTVQWTRVDAWHSLMHTCVDVWHSSRQTCMDDWHSSIHMCGCLTQFNTHMYGCLTQFKTHASHVYRISHLG